MLVSSCSVCMEYRTCTYMLYYMILGFGVWADFLYVWHASATEKTGFHFFLAVDFFFVLDDDGDSKSERPWWGLSLPERLEISVMHTQKWREPRKSCETTQFFLWETSVEATAFKMWTRPSRKGTITGYRECELSFGLHACHTFEAQLMHMTPP